MISVIFFFFFFQAEDGIRDFHVTGVQTCALPISNGRARAIDDDELARRLALARAEVEALRSMTYRSVSRTARTGTPSSEASLIRLFFSELQQRVFALAMEVLGPQILAWDADGAPSRVTSQHAGA